MLLLFAVSKVRDEDRPLKILISVDPDARTITFEVNFSFQHVPPMVALPKLH
jgi:hypothetical protein